MSFKATAAVWEHSKQKGNALLLLLAIAHFADDNGEAWPAISTLAKKVRLSDRQTKRLRQTLFDSGELQMVKKGGGRGNTDVVRIAIKGDIAMSPNAGAKSDIAMSPNTETKGDTVLSPFSAERVTNSTQRVTNPAIKGDIAMSPDPSKERSSSDDLDDDDFLIATLRRYGIDVTPHQVDHYRQKVETVGAERTIAGIVQAAKYGKQNNQRYVDRCIESTDNAPQSTNTLDFAIDEVMT